MMLTVTENNRLYFILDHCLHFNATVNLDVLIGEESAPLREAQLEKS